MLSSNFVVQYATRLAGTNWMNLLSLTNLVSRPYLFLDPAGDGRSAWFYRAFVQRAGAEDTSSPCCRDIRSVYRFLLPNELLRRANPWPVRRGGPGHPKASQVPGSTNSGSSDSSCGLRGLVFQILPITILHQPQSFPPSLCLAIFTRKIMAKFESSGDLNFLFGYAAERFGWE
jgi:hypothetical protein